MGKGRWMDMVMGRGEGGRRGLGGE